MARYRVTFVYTEYWGFEVEADDEAQASELAYAKWEDPANEPHWSEFTDEHIEELT